MDTTPVSPLSSSRGRGARLGIVLGLHGWLLGGALVAALARDGQLLGELLAVGWPPTLALCAITLLVLELTLAHCGRGRAFELALWSVLLLCVGVLMLLCSHWLAPLLERRQESRELLEHLHAVARVPDLVPILCLLASAAAGGLALRSIKA